MKILIVSTSNKMDYMLGEYINKKNLPEAEYTLVQERYGEEPLKRTFVDHYIPIYDIGDIDEVKQVAKKCEKYGKFDYIIHTDEYSVILAEKIKYLLNYGKNNIPSILKFRDKEVMKQNIQNVRKPKLYKKSELKDNPLCFPVIIKPRSYAASNGIHKADSYEELKEIIEKYQLKFLEYDMEYDYLKYEEAEENDVEIEEYIDGITYHIDGIVFYGEIIFCAASQYVNSCLDFSTGIPLGSIYVNDEKEQRDWLGFSKKNNEDLKIPDGVFHMEAFRDNKGERIFLEIAIRTGGGLIPKVTHFAQGIDLNLAHIQCQLGIKPNIKIKNHNEYGFLMISNMTLPNDRNLIVNVNLPEQALRSLVNIKLPYIGDVVERHNNYSNLIGEFLFQSNDPEQIIKDMNCLMRDYSVEVKEVVE